MIRGPKDKTAFRDHPTDWKGYVDPLPADDIATPDGETSPSVSEIKKAWPKNLTTWAAQEAARTAWKFRDTLPAMTEQEALDLIAPASDRQRNSAAARGHSVHDILEWQLDGGAGTILLGDDDPAIAYVDVVAAIVADLAPDVVASEVVVFGEHDGMRWAGTFDAVWRIDGRLVIVDYKSRKPTKAATRYPEEGAQLGAYASASYWIVEDESGLARMAPLDLDAGLILSIAPDAYCAYDVDLDLARATWRSTLQFDASRRAATSMFGRARKTTLDAKPVGGGGPTDATSDVGSVEDTNAPASDARIQWLLGRIDAAKAHGPAGGDLAALIPTGIATPRAVRAGEGTWTDADVDAWRAVLDQVEARHDIPFGPTDPNVVDELAEQRAVAQHNAPQPRPQLPAVDDIGDVATEVEVEAVRLLMREMLADPDEGTRVGEALTRWIRDASRQQRPITMGRDGAPTPARIVRVAMTALELTALVVDAADTEAADAVVRAALALVVGDDAHQIAFSVGGLLGSLTADQAAHLAEIAATHRTEIAPDGTPQLVAAA